MSARPVAPSLVDALLREQAVRISPVAELARPSERLPVSLAAVLDDRLSSVPAALVARGDSTSDIALGMFQRRGIL
jgi:hypothetical protein